MQRCSVRELRQGGCNVWSLEKSGTSPGGLLCFYHQSVEDGRLAIHRDNQTLQSYAGSTHPQLANLAPLRRAA